MPRKRAAAKPGRARAGAGKQPVYGERGGLPVLDNGEPIDRPRARFQAAVQPRRVGTEKENLAALRVKALASARNGTLASPATPGGSNWLPLGPTAIPKGQTYGGARVLVSGRVTEIAVHPTTPATIYLASARGGVWKTTNGGAMWHPMSDNEVSLAIGALGMAHSAPDTLYAGTGEGNIYYYTQDFPLDSLNESYYGSGILKTTNGGLSWARQGAAEFTGACFFRIAVHPTDPDVAFAATNRGLYRTKNGGTSWTVLGGLPAISTSVVAATDVAIDPVNPNDVYCAFWGSHVYRSTNALAATPTWTAVTGFPATNVSRISLGISPSSPGTVYAMAADAADSFKGLWVSGPGGGGTWTLIPLPAGSVEAYGAYTGHVGVDVASPNVVYLSGVSLYKAVRNPATGAWTVTDVGGAIHPDNHAFASHPTNHLTVFAGTDGGIYKSTDGGATWNDTINDDLCLTQFEFIDQHPTSDAVLFGGTQDNGTEQFRNSVVFHHAADGDGGCVAVDPANPRNVLHEYYGASPERSTQGGKFGTWSDVSAGLSGGSLFYPLFALNPANPNNIAFGTTAICLDAAQGTGGWPTTIGLPGIAGRVSALSFVNSNLIYAATSTGGVYRAVKSGGTWTAVKISAAPLPARWIWDVAPLPTDSNTVVVGMSGFGTAHVWRGVVPAGGGAATWTDISGAVPNRLPDVPVNSLQIDPAADTTMYVGTDVGIFRTTDAGGTWHPFNDGLPNTAVFDLKVHRTRRLLRAATHGRGIWERRLDTDAMPNVSTYVRDNVMDTGRYAPSPSGIGAAFEDPLQHVALGDLVWWWQCADVKIDAPEGAPPSYQLPVADVDFLAFEAKLAHRDPQRGHVNRVYVQIHNRGIVPATDVRVKVLYANASAGLPNLPADFWTAFPANSTDTSNWKPIGGVQTIASVLPTRPSILAWSWTPPMSTADHSCLLVVTDSAVDPIPAAGKVFDVGTLVSNERHVGLKNLHVVTVLPAPRTDLTTLDFRRIGRDDLVRIVSQQRRGWKVGIVFPKAVAATLQQQGFTKTKADAALTAALKKELGADYKAYAGSPLLTFDPTKAKLADFKLPAKPARFRAVLVFAMTTRSEVSVSFVQQQPAKNRVVGGNTFILRPGKL